MAFTRILIASDGSEGGQAAVRLGVEQARHSNAEVLLVHVVPLPPLVYGVDQGISDELTDYLEDRAVEATDGAAAVLEADGVKYEKIIRPGNAAHVILDIADERDVDLIVVGHRGLGAARRFILGSVTSKLAHAAKCAVLMAPVPHDGD